MFIHGFGGAAMVLRSIKTGRCAGRCRLRWLQNIKRAMESKTNPLKLTSEQRKELKSMIKEISGKRIPKIVKLTPKFNPHKLCGQRKRGRDGEMYTSKPCSRGTTRWGPKCHWVKDRKTKKNNEVKKKVTKKVTKKNVITNAKKNRPSPSVSATKFCGKKKRGNDGNMYISKPNKNGVCRWVKVK